jgi:hypothetical protein
MAGGPCEDFRGLAILRAHSVRRSAGSGISARALRPFIPVCPEFRIRPIGILRESGFPHPTRCNTGSSKAFLTSAFPLQHLQLIRDFAKPSHQLRIAHHRLPLLRWPRRSEAPVVQADGWIDHPQSRWYEALPAMRSSAAAKHILTYSTVRYILQRGTVDWFRFSSGATKTGLTRNRVKSDQCIRASSFRYFESR